MIDTQSVPDLAKKVNSLLNYGGLFINGGPSDRIIEIAYYQGELPNEIDNMRELANSLNLLADALELNLKQGHSIVMASTKDSMK